MQCHSGHEVKGVLPGLAGRRPHGSELRIGAWTSWFVNMTL
jgi:hypothetical protein